MLLRLRCFMRIVRVTFACAEVGLHESLVLYRLRVKS